MGTKLLRHGQEARATCLIRLMPLLAMALFACPLWAADNAAAEQTSAQAEHRTTAENAPAENKSAEDKHELLDPSIQSAIWVLLIFVVLAVILYKTAWKNVLTGLKAREERIRKDIADAEAARLKADESLKQYNSRLAEAEEKVRNILDKAAVDAEKLATKHARVRRCSGSVRPRSRPVSTAPNPG